MRSIASGAWRRRRAHSGAAALAAITLCTAAHAQDATWKAAPLNGDYNNSANWTPGVVPTGTAFFNTSNITSLTLSANTDVTSWTFNAGASNYTFNNSHDLTFVTTGIIVNGGSVTIVNNLGAAVQFLSTSTAGSATIINSGVVNFFNSSTADTAVITNNNNLAFFNISTAGSAVITNNAGGVVDFFETSTAGSATIINAGSLLFVQHATAGSAAITNDAGGVVDFSDSSGRNGDGKLSAGSISGAGKFYLGADQLTVGGNNQSTVVNGVISDCGVSGTECDNFASSPTGGSLVKVGTGTLTLSGINTYTGATNVNAGTLEVDGSIATSSLTTVNNGGTLTGTGTVGNLQVNSGGTFAPGAVGVPGTAMTVAGNLTFMPGAAYFIYLNPANSTSATLVGGTATLAGTVDAAFANGQYTTRQYDILHANAIDGTFAALDTFNLPVGLIASLSYTATDVFLDLTAALQLQGLNVNQLNVANAIDNFFNNGGALPPAFVNLFSLTGANLANALTALDGENATGAEHAEFELMNEFLNLMLDPYVDGRAGGGGGTGGPFGFAPDQQASFPSDVALAYAGVFKAPPKQTFARRWTAWASGFGGSATTNGDTAIGSNNVRTGTFGYAAGLDYHYSPDTALGFALAGGGTSWNLAQGLGTGHSDAFLAGLYGITHQGPAYVGGALAFADNWFATNRVALGDQLSASFQGQSYAARLEGGYRYALPVSHDALGITPYAAIQVQNFHTPSYSETDLTAGGFGLSYAAMNGTDARSELGARFDDLTTLNAMPLILRARAAWAHDWVSNPALNASFEALPGAGFTVFGAPIPHDSALTSAGAELCFTQNWSLLAKFDGEFAKGSQTYAGTGTLRYTW